MGYVTPFSAYIIIQRGISFNVFHGMDQVDFFSYYLFSSEMQKSFIYIISASSFHSSLATPLAQLYFCLVILFSSLGHHLYINEWPHHNMERYTSVIVIIWFTAQCNRLCVQNHNFNANPKL